MTQRDEQSLNLSRGYFSEEPLTHCFICQNQLTFLSQSVLDLSGAPKNQTHQHRSRVARGVSHGIAGWLPFTYLDHHAGQLLGTVVAKGCWSGCSFANPTTSLLCV